MASTGQSCPHSADSSRERGRSGRTPWSAPASLQFVFHLRGKTCAGCEHIPTQLQPQPGPFPAPRAGTLIPAYTNPPRAKHWPGASAPSHAASPSPAPAARPSTMLARQGFASYKTLGRGTALPGRELGAGGRDGRTLGSQCPCSQSPDRHRDRLAREGHRVQWQRTLEGTSAPGVLKVLQSHSSCLLLCCAAAWLPVPAPIPGAPLAPRRCRSSVFIPELPGPLISVCSLAGDRETSAGTALGVQL